MAEPQRKQATLPPITVQLIGLGVMAATWFAAFSKIATWTEWREYCEQFGAASRYISAGIPFLEVSLPFLLLSRRMSVQSLGGISLGCMYAGFSFFHWSATASGNSKPCACLGLFLALPPSEMFLVTISLALLSFAGTHWLYELIGEQMRKAGSMERSFFHIAIAILFGSVVFQSSHQSYQLEPSQYRSVFQPRGVVDDLVSSNGISTRRSSGTPNALIAVVDPLCPYSRALLTRIDFPSLPDDYALEIVYYSVLDSSRQRTKSLAEILNLVPHIPLHVSLQFFDSQVAESQREICDILLQGRVPGLYAYDGSRLYQLQAEGDVSSAIQRFSNVSARSKKLGK
ncbi:hypothetical protein QPK87_01360 [Kamptonema cortianum]|nr:hypothetical protein [Kamptonema cortianum]